MVFDSSNADLWIFAPKTGWVRVNPVLDTAAKEMEKLTKEADKLIESTRADQ